MVVKQNMRNDGMADSIIFISILITIFFSVILFFYALVFRVFIEAYAFHGVKPSGVKSIWSLSLSFKSYL